MCAIMNPNLHTLLPVIPAPAHEGSQLPLDHQTIESNIETNMTSMTKVKREEDSIQDLRLIESNLTIAELPLKEGK